MVLGLGFLIGEACCLWVSRAKHAVCLWVSRVKHAVCLWVFRANHAVCLWVSRAPSCSVKLHSEFGFWWQCGSPFLTIEMRDLYFNPCYGRIRAHPIMVGRLDGVQGSETIWWGSSAHWAKTAEHWSQKGRQSVSLESCPCGLTFAN